MRPIESTELKAIALRNLAKEDRVLLIHNLRSRQKLPRSLQVGQVCPGTWLGKTKIIFRPLDTRQTERKRSPLHRACVMKSTEGGSVHMVLEEGNERARDRRYQNCTWLVLACLI